MKNNLTTAAALLLAGAIAAQAQATSSKRIPIRKEGPAATTNTQMPASHMMHADSAGMQMDTLSAADWYMPTGTTCSSVDVSAAKQVKIHSDLYNSSTMISPDSAKVLALCAVPGQVGSGEMNAVDGRTEYAITIIPDKKKTHTKVVVDAQTGAVLSTKQMGGLRGLAGWVRESAEHKKNKQP